MNLFKKKNFLYKENFSLNPKIYYYLKIFICLNPLFFCFFLIFIDYVDYKGVTESAKYIAISQKWLGYSSGEFSTELRRLPVYPIFISFVFIIFGNDNLIALLVCQSLIGVITFFYLIKILEKLNFDKNLIILLTLFFNLHIIYRFSVFLPNGVFIFLITLFLYNFTNFFLDKDKRSFYYMCLTIFLMLLTRPIFQLSIILSIPIIIVFILKQDFLIKLKLNLIFIIILSYFLGVGAQSLRNYNAYGDLAYTTQTGLHLSLWIIPCLSQKYGCGSRNMEVHNYIEKKFKKEIENKSLNDLEKNKILTSIGVDYLINEIDKKKAVISIFFSYAKLLFHTSLTDIYPKFQINFENFSLLKGSSFVQKLITLINKSLSDPKYFFWSLSLFFLFITRFFQIVGVFLLFKDKKYFLYILLILSLILVILIPAIGNGNPRYRSEIEPLLIILGSFGISYIVKLLSNIFKKNSI